MDETAPMTRKCDNCEGIYDPETHYHVPCVGATQTDDWPGDGVNDSYTSTPGWCSVHAIPARGEMSPEMRKLASWIGSAYADARTESVRYPTETGWAQHVMSEPGHGSEEPAQLIAKGCPVCFMSLRHRTWRDTLCCLVFGHVRPIRWLNATGPHHCGRCHYNLDDNLPASCR